MFNPQTASSRGPPRTLTARIPSPGDACTIPNKNTTRRNTSPRTDHLGAAPPQPSPASSRRPSARGAQSNLLTCDEPALLELAWGLLFPSVAGWLVCRPSFFWRAVARQPRPSCHDNWSMACCKRVESRASTSAAPTQEPTRDLGGMSHHQDWLTGLDGWLEGWASYQGGERAKKPG